MRFSDRWKRDETTITAGGATGVDILDRHKSLYGPGNCARSEDTFSAGEGAFLVNRTGPVRALRGYCGANSGPTTYRVHAFYAAREHVLTVLRVHPIPGIMDYFDYSPLASGMTYRNSLNPAGVPIDGIPDTVAAGVPQWEMVSGPQGTMVITPLLETDIPGLAPTSYYSDDSTPPTTQCTGDAYEYGASGLWIQQGIPNTDPALEGQSGMLYYLQGTRRIAYETPGQNAAFAQARADEALNPLVASGRPYDPTVAVARDGPAPVRLAVVPNPVRGALGVRLALARDAEVALRVFDPAGRAVATLLHRRLAAGVHEVSWDASGLAPGLYLVRPTVDGRDLAAARFVHVE